MTLTIRTTRDFKVMLSNILVLVVLHVLSRYPEQSVAANATEPLVYTRLRHDDYFLQVLRKYTLKMPYDERKQVLKLNETYDGNKTREVEYTYYENNQIEASSITQEDLILEALDRTYKTRLMQAYLYNYDEPKDRAKSSDPQVVSAARCRRELGYLRAKQHDSTRPMAPELAAFFDSYANQEAGLLFGNYHWIGNWRQCARRHIFDLDRSNPSNSISFKGRYCIASIRSPNWEPKIKEKVQELLDEGRHFKYPKQRYDYDRFFRIQVGFCLPQSCDSMTFNDTARRDDLKQLVVHKLDEPFKSYDLVDLFCLPDENSEFRKFKIGVWLFIISTVGWILIILTATYFDYHWTSASKQTMIDNDAKQQQKNNKVAKSNAEKLVSSMSLIQNFHRLFEIESLKPPPTKQEPHQPNRPAMNDLLFLNALKVICMFFIIAGHVGMFSVLLAKFPLDFDVFDNHFLFHFKSSTVFFVDWYFVFTGFLTTFTLFLSKRVERYSLGQWVYSVFHRYWRLAPVYLIVFWFVRDCFQHLGSGPVWDYGHSNMTQRGLCLKESWWYAITLTPNWHSIHQSCLMPAWYIGSDMQFYLITPFILIALWKSAIGGWMLTIGLILASISGRMYKYFTDPNAQHLELMRPRFDLYMRNNWDMHDTYLYPQYRVPAYLMGILAGHYTYMVLTGQWTSIISYKTGCTTTSPVYSKASGEPFKLGRRFKPILRALAWYFGFALICTNAISTWLAKDLFPKSLEKHAKYFCSFLYGVNHATTGLGVSLVVVAFIMGQNTRLKKLLSHPLWTIFSRLNYFVFLIQVEVIYWLYQSSERVLEFSAVEQLKQLIQVIGITYILAAIIHIWLELPLTHLEREFIGSLMAGGGSSRPANRSPALIQTSRDADGNNAEGEQQEMTTRRVKAEQSDQLVGSHRHNTRDGV